MNALLLAGAFIPGIPLFLLGFALAKFESAARFRLIKRAGRALRIKEVQNAQLATRCKRIERIQRKLGQRPRDFGQMQFSITIVE